MVIITAKRKGELMRKTSEKILRALLAVSVLATAVLSSGCLDDEEEISDSTASDNRQTSDGGNSESSEGSEGSDNKYEGSVTGSRASKLTFSGSDGISITRKQREAEKPMGEDGTQTVFVYMCGSDLESENGLASGDIEEMIAGSQSENVKFVIQTGGAGAWADTYGISAEKTQRYVVTGGEISLIEEKESVNMGKEDVLVDFLGWGIENYAAAKMGLIFWNHGGGSISGVCFDELNENDSLSLEEIDTALTSIYDKMTDKFAFIGFDACLMATVETANMLVPHADYMFASEETEPGYGWDYTEIAGFMESNPTADTAELGKTVADSFMASCEAIGAGGEATLSITDLSRIDELVKAVNDAAEEMNDISSDPALLANAVRSIYTVRAYGSNNDTEGYTNMVDLGSMIAATVSGDKADKVMSALEKAVVYNIYGEDKDGSTGLSTYYPFGVSGSTELATFGKVCVSPYYMTFVDRIAYGAQNGSTDGYSGEKTWLADGAVYWSDGDYSDYESNWEHYNNKTDNMGFCGDKSSVQIDVGPVLDDEGTFYFNVTDDTINNLASVNCSVYRVDEETGELIEFGVDQSTKVDFSSGLVEDNFSGQWYMIENNLIPMFIVEKNGNSSVYTSPVKLNGKETNLRIAMTQDGNAYDITVLGTWDGVNENGESARSVVPLKEGDVIVPIFNTYDSEGNFAGKAEGDECTYSGDNMIEFVNLPAGDYRYSFVINDIYGNVCYTGFTVFTTDDDGNVFFTPEE